MFLVPLEHLATASQAIQDGIVAADRLVEILDLSLEKNAQRESPVDRRIRGAIDFNNVSFRYGSRRPVLREVCLHIDAGECVGIAGESGSGKTTLVNLLGRFFEPCEGSVWIDGIDVRDYSFECLRREIAFVPQDIVLFNTSIAENIRVGRPSATPDEIRAVASEARVDEIVTRHPLGFETIVGERGQALSGGERQRIGLARALLQDPAILVLDEPTSHLDAASENAVENILNRRRGRQTTVVISHRPLQLDRIIQLSQPVAVHQNPVCTDSRSKA
jgi:ABC-type multidrug transport system fused ATPase/permease subunit